MLQASASQQAVLACWLARDRASSSFYTSSAVTFSGHSWLAYKIVTLYNYALLIPSCVYRQRERCKVCVGVLLA